MAQRTPVSEQRRLVALWRQSDQTMACFCKSVGVAESTFWRWTRNHAEETAVVSTRPSFVEVTVLPEPVAVQLQVEGRAPVVLTFEGLPDAGWFGAVVREVTAC